MKLRSRFFTLLLLALLLALAPLVFSQPEPEDIGAVVEGSVDLGVLQPVQEVVAPFLKGLSALVGGIFGIYFILVVVRIYYERKNAKVLRDIRSQLVLLNKTFQKGKRRKEE